MSHSKNYTIVLITILTFAITACSTTQDTLVQRNLPDTPAQVSGDIILAAVPGSDVYETGQTLYNATCASCHGINGEGQFPQAPMQPDDTGRIGAPPHDSTGHTWHHDDDHLIRYVREGGIGDPARFYPMPGFEEQLTDDEITAVIAYIKTMWSPREQQVQQQRTQAIRQG